MDSHCSTAWPSETSTLYTSDVVTNSIIRALLKLDLHDTFIAGQSILRRRLDADYNFDIERQPRPAARADASFSAPDAHRVHIRHLVYVRYCNTIRFHIIVWCIHHGHILLLFGGNCSSSVSNQYLRSLQVCFSAAIAVLMIWMASTHFRHQDGFRCSMTYTDLAIWHETYR